MAAARAMTAPGVPSKSLNRAEPVIPLRFYRQRLCRRHLPCRSDRELQHLAKRAQICIPWPYVIVFPKIDACRTDANLMSDFCNRQTTLDSSIT
jgi:hypothetical protein